MLPRVRRERSISVAYIDHVNQFPNSFVFYQGLMFVMTSFYVPRQFINLLQWFSTEGDLGPSLPQEPFGIVWRHLKLSQLGRGRGIERCYWHLLASRVSWPRILLNLLQYKRKLDTIEIYSENVNSAKTEKP